MQLTQVQLPTWLGTPPARALLCPRVSGKKYSSHLVTSAAAPSGDPATPGPRCPFALSTSFLTESNVASGASSPLGAAGGAANATPHLWLSAGVSGQNAPGKLVSGLRKLTDLDEFLIELPEELPNELGLKQRALEDPDRRPTVLVAEPQSMAAQRECLEVFLDYLPQHYPDLYTVAGEGGQRTITVRPTGEVHRVADYSDNALELCARIVQEDLILMREDVQGDSASSSTPLQEPSKAGAVLPARSQLPASSCRGDSTGSSSRSKVHYVLTAAVVVFSFAGLPQKLSQPLNIIHAPVPGFEADLLPLLSRTFAGIKPDAPLWRNNWGLANTGEMDSPLYGTGDMSSVPPPSPSERWLRTEYQTLRRLPKSNAVLFTVRTMVEPLSALAAAPGAAATLASSLRGMSAAMRGYKGLGVEGTADAMLSYLDGLAAEADSSERQKHYTRD